MPLCYRGKQPPEQGLRLYWNFSACNARFDCSLRRVIKLLEWDAGRVQGWGRGLAVSARQLWERWKRFARKIGDFQARALMTVFYFLVIGPVAMALRWHSDPLALKPS